MDDILEVDSSLFKVKINLSEDIKPLPKAEGDEDSEGEAGPEKVEAQVTAQVFVVEGNPD